MSSHDIGFYEEMAKFVFQLSSNIIKYTPLISVLLCTGTFKEVYIGRKV